VKGALILLAAGAILSLVIFRGQAPAQILAALETQPVVRSWDPETARARLGDDVLVVDGRKGGRGVRPKGALGIPFEDRRDGTFVLPEGWEVRAVLVVMEAARATEARELARWLAAEWGLPEVATFKGGIEAWQAAHLPVEVR
jgi:hypothetical protein